MASAKLIIAADRLSRSPAWGDFLAALEDDVRIATANCVQSPPDLLQINQGRAQAAVAFLKMFQTCRVDAEKLRAQQQAQQANQKQ
jgi:hypothetical protein